MSTNDTKVTRPSFTDVYNDLSWYDEQAIAEALDVDIHDLMEAFSEGEAGVRNIVQMVRAFELVHARRVGKTDRDASKHVRELTNGQLTELMAAYLAATTEQNEDDPDEPVTEAGKDDSPSE